MARPAGCLGEREHGVQAVQALGKGGRLQANFRCALRGLRPGVRRGRRNDRQGSPPRSERKRGSRSQAIGKSRGGRTTKILALTDALGDLTRFERLPGRRCDAGGVAPPIEGIAFEGLIADKAFDAGWIIADLDARGAQGMISRRANRAAPRQIDAEIHKRRRLTENLFGKLEEFKRIALRACKTDARFAAMIHAAATTIESR